ncbi:phosphodiester glycosidase family protein [Paenibacillus sp. GSMTC-2017]|uniref:phosphodiester glycosidase family protein n=1 Tax=Paenibacillus sp. GSMTC-2017 TaxID=2794350 RepID=UPI0018D82630|nr:phosphodiester glycosidase family protein [Paenibacillus sp. GSMTC-2017]MBH5318990.1 phosphodiester glycosidase family protein [Paenibacillus sp. GSMTC-2017]
MKITVKTLNRTALLAVAPFVGIMLWLLFSSIAVELSEKSKPDVVDKEQSLAKNVFKETSVGLDQANAIAVHTQKSIKTQLNLYSKTNAEMKAIATIATTQAKRPLEMYDKKITAKLGKPASTISSDKLRAQLFYLNNDNFKSYAVKIQLKSDDAMKMVLGGSEVGHAKTTLQAVKDHNAAVGVNAGGYADGRGKRYPMSNTIVDGKYVTGFEASYADLFFVGLNDQNKLVGGEFSDKSQLDAKKPKFGASFVPVLLKGGAAQTIPPKWQTSPKRAPRTVIANYKDDQLLILVTDGYNEAGSSGATLEEVQSLLKHYGARDGYNLDGGGSSSLIFNGKVINKPSDGGLRKLPTHFLFFK